MSPENTQDGWGKFGQEQPHAFIQWKNTNVCFDFICDCGEQSHYDGWFAYKVRCVACGTVYEMPDILYPRKSTDDPNSHQVHDMIVADY